MSGYLFIVGGFITFRLYVCAYYLTQLFLLLDMLSPKYIQLAQIANWKELLKSDIERIFRNMIQRFLLIFFFVL